MQILIERSDIVGSILTGKGAHQPKDCDLRFCERVEWLIKCAEASRRIRPIVDKRWKIPIRFDPQSRLTQWAVAQELDLSETNVDFERDFASCIQDFERDFARCVQDVVLSSDNRKGQLRLQLFKRWHCASGIQAASQREEELKWILQEATAAKLPHDLLNDVELMLKQCQEKRQKDPCIGLTTVCKSGKRMSTRERERERERDDWQLVVLLWALLCAGLRPPGPMKVRHQCIT